MELKAVLSLRDKLSAKMKQASSSVHAMSQQVNQAKGQIERLSESKGLSINMQTNISEIVSQTKTAVNQLHASVDDQRLELDTMLNTQGWNLEDMEGSMSQLSSFLEQNEGKIEDYTRKLDLLKQKQSELSDTAKVSTKMGIENQIDSLQKKLEQIEVAKADFARWQEIRLKYDTLQQAEAEVQTLENALQELNSHNVAVRAYLDFKEDALKQVYNIDDKLKALQKKVISPVLRLKDKLSGPLDKAKSAIRSVGSVVAAPVVKVKDSATKALNNVRSGLAKVAGTVAYPIIKLKDAASPVVKTVSSAIKTVAGKVWDVTVKAVDKATPVIKKIGSGLGNLSKLAAKGLVIGATAAAGVAVAATGSATSKQQAVNSTLAQTGLSREEYGQEFSDIIGNLYKNNMGEDYSDLANSLAQVAQITGTTGAGLEGLTNNALLLRDTFDFDVSESVRSAKMMMDQFGISGNEAYNLIAQGAQLGLNKNGDLLDTLNEYGVHFKQLGFDSTEMMNMLVNGANSGTFSVDKLGDAVKEFGIRAKDGSDGTKQAFKDLGLDANRLTKAFATGGAEGKDAFKEVTKALASMEDPVKQNQAGVALFGTMWEDLGAEGVLAMAKLTGEVEGGTEALKRLSEVKYDDLGSAFGSLKRTFQESVLNPIGEALLPTVTNAVNVLRGFADQLGEAIRSGDMSSVAAVFEEMFSAGVTVANSALPMIVGAVTSGVAGLADVIRQNAPSMAEAAISLVLSLATGISQMLPSVLAAGVSILQSLMGGISSNMPQLLSVSAQLIVTLVTGLASGLPTLLQSGVVLLTNFVLGIIQNLPTLVAAGIQAIGSLAQGIISSLPLIISSAIQIVVSLVNTVLSNLPALMQLAAQVVLSFVQGLVANLPTIVQGAISMLQSLINSITSNLPAILQTGIQIILSLAAGIIQAIPTIISCIPQLIGGIIDSIFSTDWIAVGGDILAGIADGFMSGFTSLVDSVKGLWSDFTGWLFGESEESGASASSGIASGMTSGAGEVKSAASYISETANAGFTLDTAGIYMQGANATNSLATGISSGTENSLVAASNVSSATTSAFTLPDLSGQGLNATNSLASGINLNSSAPVLAANNVASTTASGFTLPDVSGQGLNATNSLASGISMNASVPLAAANNVSNLTAAGFVLPDISGEGTNAANSLASGISSGTETAVGAATNMSSQVASAAATEVDVKINADVTSLESFKTQIDSLATSASSSLQKLPETFTSAMDSSNSTVTSAMAQMKTTVTQGTTSVTTVVSASMAANQAVVVAGIAIINGVITAGMLLMVSAVTNGCNQAVAASRSCVSSIQSTFASVNLYSSGVNMMSGLVNGMNAMRGSVMATASSIASAAASSINNALKIHSPSRVTTDSGEYTGEGLAVGMKNSLPEIKKSAETMAEAAVPEKENPYDGLLSAQPIGEGGDTSVFNNNSSKSTVVRKIYKIDKIIENVTITNEADEDRLVQKILEVLADDFDETAENMGEEDE